MTFFRSPGRLVKTQVGVGPKRCISLTFLADAGATGLCCILRASAEGRGDEEKVRLERR